MEDVRPRRHDGVRNDVMMDAPLYLPWRTCVCAGTTASSSCTFLEGAPGLCVRDAERTPAAGDAAYLDATVPHGGRRVSREPCRALVAVVP